ncbi:MAG: cytidine deaminase [Candidatus Babeliales bacterium]
MAQLKRMLFSEFTTREQELINAALDAMRRAQAPYSNFHVGSAILTDKNEIYAGCNVERCSYTQTTHAEQNAIDTMVAHVGSAKITMVVAAAAPKGKKIELNMQSVHKNDFIASPAYTCGHCRQIIWENCYNDQSVRCVLIAENGDIYCTTIGDLLPFPFGPTALGITYSTER